MKIKCATPAIRETLWIIIIIVKWILVCRRLYACSMLNDQFSMGFFAKQQNIEDPTAVTIGTQNSK